MKRSQKRAPRATSRERSSDPYVLHASGCAVCLAAPHPSAVCPKGHDLLAKTVATFSVKGRPWTVEKRWRIEGDHEGLCVYTARKIQYVEAPDKHATLDTLLHELLHAFAADWSERRVQHVAGTMVSVLKQVGLV